MRRADTGAKKRADGAADKRSDAAAKKAADAAAKKGADGAVKKRAGTPATTRADTAAERSADAAAQSEAAGRQAADEESWLGREPTAEEIAFHRKARDAELTERRRPPEKASGPLKLSDWLLLVCCAATPGSGAEVIRFARQANIALRMSERAIYTRLETLVKRGLLERDDVVERGDRVVYKPSEWASKLVREWLQTPAALPSFDSDLFVRLHAGRSNVPGRLTGGLLALHETLEARLLRVKALKQAERLSFAGLSLTAELAYDLQVALLEAYQGWWRQAVKKLPPALGDGHSVDERGRRGAWPGSERGEWE